MVMIVNMSEVYTRRVKSRAMCRMNPSENSYRNLISYLRRVHMIWARGVWIAIYKSRKNLPNKMEIEGPLSNYHVMCHIFWRPTSRTLASMSLKSIPAWPEIEPIRLSASTWPSERPTWLARYASSSLPVDACQPMTSFCTR